MEVETVTKKQGQGFLDELVFNFASLGAATLDAIIILFLLKFVLLAFGVQMSTSSIYWVFLFLFPGTLVGSRYILAKLLGREGGVNVLYSIIAGYGAYSLLSFLIMILNPQADPEGWFVLILGISTLAVLFSDRYSSVAKDNEVIILEGVTQQGDLGVTVSSAKTAEKAPKSPILLIRAPKSEGPDASKGESKDR